MNRDTAIGGTPEPVRRGANLTRVRTSIGALSVAVITVTVVLVSAPAASVTESTSPFDGTVDVSTHMVGLNQTVAAPPGSLTGTVDRVTGRLQGHLALPPATATVKIAGLGLVTATFQITEVKPVTGRVDFTTFQATATSVFAIRLVRASPAGLPLVNLVGNSCTTTTPMTVTVSGTASLTGTSTFGGTYTIPPLHHCGLATTALNLVLPGPGNTFTAVVGPHT